MAVLGGTMVKNLFSSDVRSNQAANSVLGTGIVAAASIKSIVSPLPKRNPYTSKERAITGEMNYR
jgi:hypothetical protein